MDPEILKLLEESAKEVLTEDSLKKIQEAVEKRAEEIAKEKFELKIESKLAKQDAVYAEKLENFIGEVDEDHTNKMKQLVEALDNKRAGQLQQVVEKYKNGYAKECKLFKENLVKKIDKYFDLVVDEQIPAKQINEAVENTRAKKLLEQIGKMIGMDKIQQNKIVKEGIMDAKNEIDTLTEKVNQLEAEKQKLINERLDVKRDRLLTEKTKGLPKVKKDYIMKVLGKKSLDFINENFDYTLELYDSDEEESTAKLKEDATGKTKVISEGVDVTKQEPKQEEPFNHADQYMEELSKI